MIRKWYPHIVSTAALVVALTMGGAYATERWIHPKQIRPGTIQARHIKKNAVAARHLGRNAVRARQIAKGQIRAPHIGNNQITGRAIASNEISGDHIAPRSIGQKEVAPNAIGTTQIAAGAVGSAAIADGSIRSADIGDGQVTPTELRLPRPLQIQTPAGQFPVRHMPQTYQRLALIGIYAKEDATTDLQVTWTGIAKAGFSPCVFQIRVDGQPSAVNAGELYIPNGSTVPVSATSLFRGRAAGRRSIEIWARAIHDGSGTPQGGYPCEIGPEEATVGQTFVIAEQVS